MGLTKPKYPCPAFGTFLTGGNAGSKKLQRHYCQHCGTTKVTEIILLNTQATQLTQDWLKLTMGHVKGSNLWKRTDFTI